MPRIKRIESSNEFQALNEATTGFNETNDCTVKALALVCDIPYSAAHATLKRLGRKDRKGIPMRGVLKEALAEHGFKGSKISMRGQIAQYPGCHKNLQSVTTHHPARFSKVWKDGRCYLFFVSRHVAAVIDGRTHDWSEGRAKRCQDIYEITKADLPKPLDDRPNVAPKTNLGRADGLLNKKVRMSELSDLPYAVVGEVIAVWPNQIEVCDEDGDLTNYKYNKDAKCWVRGAMPYSLKITK